MASVSIVIPSFRQPQFLCRAIDSCLEQDFFDLEVIVVDDRSLDQSLAVAASRATYDPRVRVLARQINGGLGRARNCGLEAAEGKYVMFLDADDYLLPGAVSGLYSVLAGCDRDDVAGSYGEWLHVPESVDEPAQIRAANPDLPELSKHNFAGANLFICSAPMTRRSALERVGGFAENLPMLEDFVAWVRIIAEGGVFLPAGQLVCTYRQRPSSMLRGEGPTMPLIADGIQRWWLERGLPIASTGEVAGWAEQRRPEPLRRRSWTVSATFIRRDWTAAPASELATTDDDSPPAHWYEATRLALTRSRDDLVGLLDGVAELSKVDGVLRRPQADGGRFDVVLVPTSIESAFEAIALQAGLDARGVEAAIGLRHATQLDDVWPVLEAVGGLAHLADLDASGQAVLVMASDERRAAELKRRHQGWRVALRTSGVMPYRCVGARGTARFHSLAGLLVRSRLEAAELGDWPGAVIPSGVGHAFEQLGLQASPTNAPVVYLPDTHVTYPAVEAWLSSAIRVAGDDHRALVMGEQRIRDELRQFRIAPVNPALLAGATAVVAPLSDAGSMIEAFGVPLVYFEPSLNDSEWSTPWLRCQRVARTEDELARFLEEPIGGTDDHRRWLRELANAHDADGTTFDAWAKQFESALAGLW